MQEGYIRLLFAAEAFAIPAWYHRLTESLEDKAVGLTTG